MPFHIVRQDIARMTADAIVAPTDIWLSGSGGADAAIHHSAGPMIEASCEALGQCAPGQAVITPAFELNAKYVIHTVGPIWAGGNACEFDILAGCYHNSMRLALAAGCESIAFPLIASGTFGFPKQEALNIASREIRSFLDAHEMTVYLVVYDPQTYQISRGLFDSVTAYIDDHHRPFAFESARVCDDSEFLPDSMAAPQFAGSFVKSCSLEEALDDAGETFTQALLRLIDEKGLKDSQCYKKANMDRRLFSKIRSDIHYQPRKSTVLALAVAMELDLEETDDLLSRAGLAFSPSNRADIIVHYFIANKKYDIFTLNETLFAFGEKPLTE